ncbi:MAG: SHOCT domain-containing protein [Gammaproteobacteria bacterium]
MPRLTDQGQQIINDLAQRYGVSNDAVMTLLSAVQNGNGTMAQFSHPDFGGSGQWMQGGMTMVGDMFNYALKSKVEGLCSELSNLLANQQPSLFRPESYQSQFQGGGSQQQSSGYGPAVSLFVPGTATQGNWWPADLGFPASSGAQNNIRYAYFPSNRRLAVEINGHVTVYDTLDHQIGGVSQQQGGDASLTFTSQYGLVRVENLPVVTIDGAAPQPAAPEPIAAPANTGYDNGQGDDIFKKIEQLAELRKKGILSEEEFAIKKKELLQKI